MTTSGPVIDQPSVATQAGVGRAREAGVKGDVAGQSGEKDGEFGEVLSTLQGEDGRSSEVPGPAKGGSRAGERTGLWRHEVAVQLAPGDGEADAAAHAADDLPQAGDTLLQATPDGALPANAVGSDAAAVVNNIAAAAGVTARPSTEVRKPDADAHVATRRSADVGGSAMAALDAKAQAAEAPDPLDAGQRAGADLNLARIAGRAGDKDASNTVDGPPAGGADPVPVPRPGESEVRAPRHDAAQPPRANVLRQETHFAPVPAAASSGSDAGGAAVDKRVGPEPAAPEAASSVDGATPAFDGSLPAGASPARQIADRIVAEAAPGPAFADRAGVTPEQQGAKPALKVLHIALQPADLGIVEVRMELKDTELTLHVEAERAETAELIRNDQDTLSKLLRSAGYAVDGGSIRVADVASTPSGQNGTQTNLNSSAQSQQGAAERQGHGHRGAPGSNAHANGPQTSRNDTHETQTIRPGVGLYI
jgi:chemotaxis protein MotD